MKAALSGSTGAALTSTFHQLSGGKSVRQRSATHRLARAGSGEKRQEQGREGHRYGARR